MFKLTEDEERYLLELLAAGDLEVRLAEKYSALISKDEVLSKIPEQFRKDLISNFVMAAIESQWDILEQMFGKKFSDQIVAQVLARFSGSPTPQAKPEMLSPEEFFDDDFGPDDDSTLH